MGALYNPVAQRPFAAVAWPVAKSGAVLPAGYAALVVTTAANVVLLPAAPAEAAAVAIEDISGDAPANPITVNGNGHTIDGSASIMLASAGEICTLVFDAATSMWRRSLSYLLPQPTTVPNPLPQPPVQPSSSAPLAAYGVASSVGGGGGGGGSSGSAGTIQTADGSGGFVGATGVLASPTGITLPNNVPLIGLLTDGVTPEVIAKIGPDNYFTVGAPGSTLQWGGTAGINDFIAGSCFRATDGVAFLNNLPIVGGLTPYGCHGRQPIGVVSGTHVLTVLEASAYTWALSGVAIGASIEAPPANSATTSYTRNVQNGSSTIVTVKVSGGANTIDVAPGNAAILEFTDADVWRVTADTPFTT